MGNFPGAYRYAVPLTGACLRSGDGSMRGAKWSVRTGPRMEVVSTTTSTTLSDRPSTIRCPAELNVSRCTEANFFRIGDHLDTARKTATKKYDI